MEDIIIKKQKKLIEYLIEEYVEEVKKSLMAADCIENKKDEINNLCEKLYNEKNIDWERLVDFAVKECGFKRRAGIHIIFHDGKYDRYLVSFYKSGIFEITDTIIKKDMTFYEMLKIIKLLANKE